MVIEVYAKCTKVKEISPRTDSFSVLNIQLKLTPACTLGLCELSLIHLQALVKGQCDICRINAVILQVDLNLSLREFDAPH